MGDIADMMLDGTLCEGCGTYMDDDGAEGFPRYCSDQCAGDRGADHAPSVLSFVLEKPKKAKCSICGRRVKAAELADHHRDVHQEKNSG